ncbi:hypothetical protein BIW11_02707 [Tropilaelaps mercedesae]|uniref:Uncharacterized protein n=1 Tax=Tropilaelaps mercedesae TaxID=418985 RepID=A0A1V9XYZ0_9ACAR|nr:hypothetical protein BIW11_02707 [Tropilaelaps mercedesae]
MASPSSFVVPPSLRRVRRSRLPGTSQSPLRGLWTNASRRAGVFVPELQIRVAKTVRGGYGVRPGNSAGQRLVATGGRTNASSQHRRVQHTPAKSVFVLAVFRPGSS